jgi:hypothetical protein
MNFFVKKIKKGLQYFGINIMRVPRNNKNILSNRLSTFLNIGFNYEKEAFEAMQIVKFNTMLPYEPLVSLYEQVVYCEKNNIEGAFVECGTWKGGASGMMALANLKYGSIRRELHLFDAFEEICQPNSEYDDEKLIQEVKDVAKVESFGVELKPIKGIYDVFGGPGTIENNKKLIEGIINYPSQKVHYHKGWFQDTVPVDANKIDKIAILRLDGDWYESTKVCLDHLYDKVVKNGIVIIDDYGYNTGCKKAVDEFLLKLNHFPIINYINGTCRYFIKPS